MGNLISVPIPSLFNGVSRQPDFVRLPGQVQEADNALMSVVTGGFEKRPGTAMKAALTAVPNTNTMFFHTIIRDAVERYLVLVANGQLYIYSLLDGSQKTVNAPAAAAATYLATAPADNLAMVTIADYTVVVNKNVVVKMATFTPGPTPAPARNYSEIAATTGTVGQMYRILGEATTLDDYYVIWDPVTTSWIEAADPTIANAFDLTTMPHLLVREADGTFTFKQGTWAPRKVGDAQIVPNPDFVGRKISDLVFHRDRLAACTDEVVFFSQSGDYFSFWPDKSTQVLDSDPFGRTASGGGVSLLRFATPFRKSLFLTADQTQFEVSGDVVLTPAKASIDPATSYRASSLCRPIALADDLYFAADSAQDAVLFEYYYDQQTLGTTAGDVTKHCKGYIPAPLVRLSGDTTTGTMVALSNADRTSLYVYRFYWDNQTKAQSAWAKWTFGTDAYIHGMVFIGADLFMVVRRANGTTYLEHLSVADESSTVDLDAYNVRLDRRVAVAGTYNAGTKRTTWTLPYPHDGSITALLGTGFSSLLVGQQLGDALITYDTSTTFSIAGNFSAGTVIAGKRYRRRVVLSKLYPHDSATTSTNVGRSITAGRCQMKSISFDYQNTGYFEVHVTPEYRETQVHVFTGRTVGSAGSLIGVPAIKDAGTFKCNIGSRANTVEIAIDDTSYMPSVIVSATWMGFFNEVSRAE